MSLSTQRKLITQTLRTTLFLGLIAPSIGGCKPAHRTESEVLATEAPATVIDMAAKHEAFVNNDKVRLAYGSIASAMGYGWYWGCPGDHPGWVRSATETTRFDDGLGAYRVNFAPANASSCPGDQAGLRSTVTTLIVPWESMVVSAPKTLPKGQPRVLASMTCGGNSSGSCELKRSVNIGYKTMTSNSRELSFGQELSMAFKLEFSAAPLGVGSKTNLDFGFKANFGQKITKTDAAENSHSETVEYRCPLHRDVPIGRTYVGRLISIPARIAVDYRVKALLVPTLTLDGFPRIQDDHGNHWLDHPTNRPRRQQQYGNSKLFFWREMDGYLNGGMTRKDANSDAEFSWADLKRVAEHEQLVRQNIGYLMSLESQLSGVGTGTAITEVDDVVCQWIDTSGGNKKTIAAKRLKPNGGGAQLTDTEKSRGRLATTDWSDIPLDDEILRVLENLAD